MPDHKNISGRDCVAVRTLLPAYARGDLDPDREDGLLEHAAGCPACREALAEADPASLFWELRGRSLPGGFWQGFDQSLRARLAEERQSGWRWSVAWEALGALLRPPRLAYYFAAPLAMVFLLGVTLYVSRPGLFGPGPRTHGPEDGVRSPYSPPVVPRRGGADTRADRETAPAAQLAASGILEAELQPLEEVSSPAARIYRLDVAGQDPTPIYMVVDETIDF